MADVLFRGRGADSGARAPLFIVRLAGAALAFGIYALAADLGVWTATGVQGWWARLSLLALGALLAPTRVGAWLWMLAGALVTLSCVVGFTPVVRPAVNALVRSDSGRLDRPLDAVVVLSGGLTDEGRLTGPALDRLLTGLSEVRSRGIRELALSVTAQESRGVRITSEADQRALVTLGGNGVTLHTVRNVHSTRDEALAFAALGRARGWRRVLLVTSPTHTRRACAAVELAGLPVQCHPSRARDYAISRLDLSENRRRGFADLLYEGSATLLYRSRSWIP
ncbi:MAG TPA: YdcF family protein [Gemmatimonas sp.]|nr:YdcF family protein [Gemmatimonas sp.]